MRTAQNLATFVRLFVMVYTTLTVILLTVVFMVLWGIATLVGRLLR